MNNLEKDMIEKIIIYAEHIKTDVEYILSNCEELTKSNSPKDDLLAIELAFSRILELSDNGYDFVRETSYCLEK